MINCIIIEDEPLAQDVLKKYIEDYPLLNLCGTYKDALEAQKELQHIKAELIFLDINLPKLSGINFLKTLHNPPQIIFTTAYPDFAVEGFELNALDYLLKPFSFERFVKAVNKALEKQEKNTTGNDKQEYIFLKADKKMFKVNLADIQYAEALNDYVKVVTDQTSFLVYTTLKNLYEDLPENEFIRVHKSFLIAKNKIVFMEGNYIKVGQKEVPVGASYKEELQDFLKLKKRY